MAQTIAKFRPVLSSEDILHIISLAKKDGTKKSLEIVASFAKLEWQIKNNAIAPAYISSQKVSLAESMGLDESSSQNNNENTSDAGDSTNIEALYTIWMSEPESLTVSQLERVRAFRYENNKMSQKEEKLFESEVLGIDIGSINEPL